MNSRRKFLRNALQAGAAGATLGRFGVLNAFASKTAATSSYKALVCVFLYGGNDSNNLIVPVVTGGSNYSAYAAIRQNLALAAPSASAPAGTTLLPIGFGNETYGLHPQLGALQNMWNAKRLAVVANVGTLVAPTTRVQFLNPPSTVTLPNNLFSHADQVAGMQTAKPLGFATNGWGGRLADVIELLGLNPASATFPTLVSVTGTSQFGTGATTHPGAVPPGGAIGLQGYDTSQVAADRLFALKSLLSQELLQTSSGAALIREAATITENGINDSDKLNLALKGAKGIGTAFPNTSIGQQLLEVAKLIQVRDALGMNRQIFFCSLGGFDTHSTQLTDQGNLFTQLNAALAAFEQSLNAELSEVAGGVTLFTESDFSRTMQPNSNGGSDHAWGSHHLVLGPGVQGGKLYGKFPSLVLNSNDDAGGEGRWIPTTAVDQYGATLAQWFGVPKANLATVFPNLVNFQNAAKLPPTYPVYADPTNVGFMG